MHLTFRLVPLAAVLALAAACSSGGSGTTPVASAPPPPAPSPSPTPPAVPDAPSGPIPSGGLSSVVSGTTVVMSGPSVTVTGTIDPAAGVDIDPLTLGTATVEALRDNATFLTWDAQGDGTNVAFTQAQLVSGSGFAGTLVEGLPVIDADVDTPTENRELGVILGLVNRQFEHQVFGRWARNGIDGTNAFSRTVASVGTETAAGSVPTSGFSNYDGLAGGEFQTAGGEVGQFLADMSATVGFGGPTPSFDFATSNTRTQALDGTGPITPAAALDMTGSGTLSGARLTGTVQAQADVSGTLEGRLYGPGAVEIGGVMRLEGPDGVVLGAFGGWLGGAGN